MNNKNTLSTLISYFGSVNDTAKALNVRQNVVSMWKRRGVPAYQAIEIEKITEGRFRAVDFYQTKSKES